MNDAFMKKGVIFPREEVISFRKIHHN